MAVSLDGPSEVEPLRRFYGHDREHWLIDQLELTARETAQPHEEFTVGLDGVDPVDLPHVTRVLCS